MSKGELATIEIVGGPDAGFLAAIAEWLFNLRVSIQSENGDIMYTNDTQIDNVEVKVTFSRASNADQASTELTGKTYFLDDSSEMFIKFDGGKDTRRDYTLTVVGGRLDWTDCLSAAFNPEFAKLTSRSDAVVAALENAARLLEYEYDVEAGKYTYFKRLSLRVRAASGAGFIDNLMARFPELQVMGVGKSRRALRLDRVASCHNYLKAVQSITQLCGCKYCGEASPSVQDLEQYCLVIILETIMAIGMMTSGMVSSIYLNILQNLCTRKSSFRAFVDIDKIQ